MISAELDGLKDLRAIPICHLYMWQPDGGRLRVKLSSISHCSDGAHVLAAPRDSPGGIQGYSGSFNKRPGTLKEISEPLYPTVYGNATPISCKYILIYLKERIFTYITDVLKSNSLSINKVK